MEAREHGGELKAAMLINEFAKKFRSIDYTVHPSDLPGEVAGKGSNAAWAARKISEKYSIGQRKDVIVTGIDGMSIAPFFVLVGDLEICGRGVVCLALCTS